jgi:hypothetical protein
MEPVSLAVWGMPGPSWYLEHSDTLAPPVFGDEVRNGPPTLRLWHDMASFSIHSEPTSLTIFEMPASWGEVVVVRKVEWHRSKDLQRDPTQPARVVEPTLVVRDAPVPAAEWRVVLGQAASFSVPVIWLQERAHITTDSGTAGLDFFSRDDPPAVLKLQWSDGMPDSWKPVTQWWEFCLTFLEDCLAKAGRDSEKGTS